jgi:hypothetical protein
MSKRTNRRKLRKQIVKQTHEKWQKRRAVQGAREFAAQIGEQANGLDPIRHNPTR